MEAVLSPTMFAIYLAYGLAFVLLGTLLGLEMGRAPRLAAARVLLPLAVFGALHGLHEWVELALQLEPGQGWFLPPWLPWLRVGMLVLSFLSLVAYGVQVLYPPRRLAARDVWVGVGLLFFYLAVLLGIALLKPLPPEALLLQADRLARYGLGAPGALLAAFALRHRARELIAENRASLARGLLWAALCFALYALSQVLVQPGRWQSPDWLNAIGIGKILRMRMEVVRTVLAAGMALGLLHAIQAAEQERRQAMEEAQQARLRELVHREALRRELLRRIVQAQEDERARIARELHDETAQTLTAFSLHLAALQNHVKDNLAATYHLQQARTLGDQVARRLQHLVHDLRPAQLDDLGLIPALECLVEDLHYHLGLRTALNVQKASRRIDPTLETVIFRVVQEALTNVVRHAGTDQAEVCLVFGEDEVQLEVRDQGVGFDLEQKPRSEWSWGLMGMQERVEAVGGTLEVDSAPGRGTRIRARLPARLEPIEEEGE